MTLTLASINLFFGVFVFGSKLFGGVLNRRSLDVATTSVTTLSQMPSPILNLQSVISSELSLGKFGLLARIFAVGIEVRR